VAGQVQGVGFRPFVYRIANKHRLTGQVLNKPGEVEIIVSGNAVAIDHFTDELLNRAPPLARPMLRSAEPVDAPPFSTFSITASTEDADANIFVPPDYFMCDACSAELDDPNDRRYRYPFINCTQCGPRYTLISKLPYDRPNTSMAAFELCRACKKEYEDPLDRRFHAEPVACPECGPQVTYSVPGGRESVAAEAALDAALETLRAGRVLAVKGVGGYHLMCDAGDPAAVARLRRRKERPAKPLAVMFPLAGEQGLAAARNAVSLSRAEAEMLLDPMRPIVLARKRRDSSIAANVAPGLAELGVFLPYAPLHQLLLGDFSRPVVATSGNLSGEPVLTDNAEVRQRLRRIADGFLDHDRPILRPADDSVYRSIAGRLRPLRIGRGAAPRELELPFRLREPVLAVGAHMKGTIAIGWENRAVVSPHIGEMASPRSMTVFESVTADLQSLYGVAARQVVCDAHPGYSTHRWARSQSALPLATVWHHFAHASALAAEYPGGDNWLVFTWDGVGLGPDGSLWGGEALYGRPGNWQRLASMRPFCLPGGERAGREPWRSAAALHWACGMHWADCPDADGLLRAAWQRNLHAPQTTAVGRLFDAASALVCGLHEVSFEAQGPMTLEGLCEGGDEVIPFPAIRDDNGLWRADWQPLLAVLKDENRSRESRAGMFHASMAALILDQARLIAREWQVDRIGLTGGVFQNRVLTGAASGLLEAEGFEVCLSSALPCNDAAIAFGQLAEYAARAAQGHAGG